MNFPSHAMHAATTCATHLLRHLTEPQIPELLHTLALTLSAGCHRWQIARIVTKGLWITIQQQKLEEYLQAETISLFQLNAVENWSQEDYRRFVSCVYPDYASSNGNPRDVVSMGDLLSSYAKLDVNDPGEDTVNTQINELGAGEGPSSRR